MIQQHKRLHRLGRVLEEYNKKEIRERRQDGVPYFREVLEDYDTINMAIDLHYIIVNPDGSLEMTREGQEMYGELDKEFYDENKQWLLLGAGWLLSKLS